MTLDVNEVALVQSYSLQHFHNSCRLETNHIVENRGQLGYIHMLGDYVVNKSVEFLCMLIWKALKLLREKAVTYLSITLWQCICIYTMILFFKKERNI